MYGSSLREVLWNMTKVRVKPIYEKGRMMSGQRSASIRSTTIGWWGCCGAMYPLGERGLVRRMGSVAHGADVPFATEQRGIEKTTRETES